MSKVKKQFVELVHSRRRFMRDLSILSASVGMAASTRFEFINDLARLAIPSAHADDGPPVRRMIYVGVRAGAPLIGFATPEVFSKEAEPVFPNAPFAGKEFVREANGLFLTPDALPLKPHAANIAITQGIKNEGGHTSLFDFWEGGKGAKLTSPIIDLADQNTSGSVVPGVQFIQSKNRGSDVEHQTNGLPDLLLTDNDSFRDNFKKPSLVLSEDSAAKVMQAASRLSRRQALRMTQALEDARVVSTEHGKAAQLMNYDYREALNPAELDKEFSSGSGNYKKFGESLAYTLKAMSLNLVNSATVTLSIGDWHGHQSDKGNRYYFQEVSKKLAKAIEYMKATPDPASLKGETLWDTTAIVLGSEFTRRDRTFGHDNGDGGSQGIMLIGKYVKGGYFGAAEISKSGQYGVKYSGIDRETGAPLPGDNRNTTTQVYHTIARLVDARTTDTNQVLNAMLYKSLF